MSTNNKAKNVWWLYQARRINTSGGSGALVTRISANPGQVIKLSSLYAKGAASATSVLVCYLYDEDGALVARVALIAAGASRELSLPSIGTAPSHQNIIDSLDLIIGPGMFLTMTSDVSVLNETLTVGVSLLLSTPVIPVWDIVGSVGGSALAASTISANTLQAVLM